MVQKKFALIEYFELHEVEIVETRFFMTHIEPSSFNGEDWLAQTQIHVMWPQKKKAAKTKQQKHVARVLKFGDDHASLVPFLKATENGKEFSLSGDLEFGRGKRTKEPKRIWSSESESSTDEETISERQQNKRRREVRNAIEEDAVEELRTTLNQETSRVNHGESEEMKALRNEVYKLREENEALRNTLRIDKGLPELLHQIDYAKKVFVAQLTNNSGSQVERNVFPSNSTTTPTTSAQSPSATALSSPTSRTGFRPLPQSRPGPQTVFNHPVDENGQVDLGYGVAVNASNLQYVSRVDAKKTTYTLCEAVFSRTELANSSLTGKKSNAFKDQAQRPPLDENKLSAVIQFVKKLHPGVEERDVKKFVGAKLNICQKLEKRKEIPKND